MENFLFDKHKNFKFKVCYSGGIDPKCKRASAAEKGENGLHHELKVF